MMKKNISLILFWIFLPVSIPVQASDAEIGKKAPGFTLTDSNGYEHSLSEYKGKFVVLEWINFDCPFVGKHYKSGNMQKLQKEYTGKGVVWLTINSSAPGKQGNYPVEDIQKKSKEYDTGFTAYLIDESGEVGKLYGAKTTPHMYVINPEGILIYAGGIDNTPSTDVDDTKTAKNFVAAALDEAMNGKDVTVKVSQPYGCSVKYK